MSVVTANITVEVDREKRSAEVSGSKVFLRNPNVNLSFSSSVTQDDVNAGLVFEIYFGDRILSRIGTAGSVSGDWTVSESGIVSGVLTTNTVELIKHFFYLGDKCFKFFSFQVRDTLTKICPICTGRIAIYNFNSGTGIPSEILINELESASAMKLEFENEYIEMVNSAKTALEAAYDDYVEKENALSSQLSTYKEELLSSVTATATNVATALIEQHNDSGMSHGDIRNTVVFVGDAIYLCIDSQNGWWMKEIPSEANEYGECTVMLEQAYRYKYNSSTRTFDKYSFQGVPGVWVKEVE